MAKMKCKQCGKAEDRVHGFCSCHCEELHDKDAKIASLKADLALQKDARAKAATRYEAAEARVEELSVACADREAERNLSRRVVEGQKARMAVLVGALGPMFRYAAGMLMHREHVAAGDQDLYTADITKAEAALSSAPEEATRLLAVRTAGITWSAAVDERTRHSVLMQAIPRGRTIRPGTDEWEVTEQYSKASDVCDQARAELLTAVRALNV